MVTMIVLVIVTVASVVDVRVFVYAELRRRDAGLDDADNRHVPPFDGEAAKRALQLLERQSRVEQRADDHVARRTRETIEVENLQSNPSALKLKCEPPPRMM